VWLVVQHLVVDQTHRRYFGEVVVGLQGQLLAAAVQKVRIDAERVLELAADGTVEGQG